MAKLGAGPGLGAHSPNSWSSSCYIQGLRHLPAGGSRGAGWPASGSGFPPSSFPVPFCSSLTLILPDFLWPSFSPLSSTALSPPAVFPRISGAWGSVQDTVLLSLAALCSPGPSALSSCVQAEGPETPVELPPAHLEVATTQSL